jgi:hypothetical protein
MRYRLRTLLIVLTIFGVWLGMCVNAARRQARAVAEIKKQRTGRVVYDFESSAMPGEVPQSWVPQWILARTGLDLFHDVVEARMDVLNGYQPADAPLIVANMKRHVAALPRLNRLTIMVGPEGSDGCLEAASCAVDLEFLRCWNATDAGVVHLTRLQHLTFVGLDNSQLTDEALHTLGQMQQIEWLSLQNNQFTDAGLAHLSNLRSLKQLWVDTGRSRFSDAGLIHLESLQNLEALGLQETLVTPQGIARLQQAVPSLKSVPFSPPPP